MSNYPRFDELQLALEKDRFHKFYETIDTIEEIETVKAIMHESFQGKQVEKLDLHKKLIEKYSERNLSEFSFHKHPLTFAALSRPGGKIALFLFLDSVDGLSPSYHLLPLIEHILKQMELGVKRIEIKEGQFNDFTCKLLSYYTQYPFRYLLRILFPDLTSRGGGSGGFYWSFEENVEPLPGLQKVR